MPLPTKQKTWQISTSRHDFGSDARDSARRAVFNLLDALVSFPTNPFIVDGSNDSVTGGMDGVNRITDHTKWISFSGTSAGQSSWICLRCPVVGFQLMLEARYITVNNFEAQWRFWISPSGSFTGGSSTEAPTAPDQVSMNGQTSNSVYTNFASAPSIFASVCNVWRSTDGEQTMIVFLKDGGDPSFTFVGRVANPTPGLALGGLVWAHYYSLGSNIGNAMRVGNFCRIATGNIYTVEPGGTIPLSIATPALGTANGNYLFNQDAGIYQNSWTGEWHWEPMSLYANSWSLGAVGKVGTLVDLYWGAPGILHGRCYPSDSSRQWIHLGEFIFPWDGSVPVLQ